MIMKINQTAVVLTNLHPQYWYSLVLQSLKTEGIRCSVIGLAAEVRICKKLCQDTGGEYGVSV